MARWARYGESVAHCARFLKLEKHCVGRGAERCGADAMANVFALFESGGFGALKLWYTFCGTRSGTTLK